MECIDITKHFGHFTAVDSVSFSIPQGSFFSILGPSGCGKTTLLRMIAGFEKPDGGDIRIGGKSVLGVAPNHRNAKMVFQHLALFPMMNVAENIAYGLRCQGESRHEIDRKVAEVLERVGLPDSGEKQIHQLSGGQRQRIAIARCMVLQPEVLLLDEPLGALDLKLREHMKVELKMLQRTFNITFIYITHDQSEALVMSDAVAVMNQGRFEQIGTPQELYYQPRTAFVAGFVGESNHWRGKVVAAQGGKVRVEADNGAVFGGSADGLAEGAAVEVFVRPEVVRIDIADTAGESGENRQVGVVESVLFNGANSRVLVQTANGERMEAVLPQTAEYSHLRYGMRVALSWSECRFFSGS